jgi:hypothetical protein
MQDYPLFLPNRIPKILKTAELVCERCGEKFTVPFWMIKKGRRFCKAECRRQDPLKTLLSRADKQENGCWNYTGTIGWGGYGQIKVGNTNWNAHKLMWMLSNKRQVPKGLVVRHTCIGNRKCINPDHLIIGTQKENVHDMIRQGRFRVAVGIERSYSRFTADDVRRIRSLKQPGTTSPSYKSIAKLFNVRTGMIWQVVNMKSYKTIV